MNYEPEHGGGFIVSTNLDPQYHDFVKENVLPEKADKNFEIVYVAQRLYNDGYKQLVVCVRTTNPNVVQEKNKPLPASALVYTGLLFFGIK